MKKILLLIAASFIGVVAAQAQEVMPIYVEGKVSPKALKGQFTVVNKSLQAMPVTVEPHQLQMVNGQPKFGPLDASTQVELKDTSAVIPPRGSRTFDYKVRCQNDCMVTLLSGMVTGKTKEGVQVKLWLMHSAYLCSEVRDCRVRIKKQAGLP
jgi:hypothetical protein